MFTEGGRSRRLFAAASALLLLASIAGCRKHDFPSYDSHYREYGYVTNGGNATVTVLDLVNLRQDRVIAVGENPTGVAINPNRNEVYVVNSGSNSVSVINAQNNTVAATIPVHHTPYYIDIDAQGARGYVANSGSNNVSVIDLAARKEIAAIGTGESPGWQRLLPTPRRWW